jgi:hypothetical protein
MSWIAGLRQGVLYSIKKRPIDPRWSTNHIQKALGFCATGMHLGMTESRAFQAAEAIIMMEVCPGISWSNQALYEDMDVILGIKQLNCLEETT